MSLHNLVIPSRRNLQSFLWKVYFLVLAYQVKFYFYHKVNQLCQGNDKNVLNSSIVASSHTNPYDFQGNRLGRRHVNTVFFM